VGAHGRVPALGAHLLSREDTARRPTSLSRPASTSLAAGALAIARVWTVARVLAVATPLLVLAALVVVALTGSARLAEPPARTVLSADVTPARQRETPWSTPAGLSACAAQAPARVVFPSDSPSRATGPGAIVWSASAGCPGGNGARVAAIGAEDEPGASVVPHTASGRPIAPRGALQASGAPHGQIVIAGSAPGTPTDGLLIQGAAGGPFRGLALSEGAGAPMVLTTAYLGDVALASPPAPALTPPSVPALTPASAYTSPGTRASPQGAGLDIHVERFFAHDFIRNVATRGAGAGAVRALTLAMDYRSEALAVWAQGGSIYARLIPQRGAAGPLQRLGPAGAHTQIAAVLSDDRRAIVAWAQGRGSETTVYLDRSATGVRFGARQLLERFHDPDGLPSPVASPSLVRLSSESVVLAWAGSAAGRWVIRAAPVDLNGLEAISTIAAPSGDALLADLAAGPVGDALVLWTEPAPTAAGAPDLQRQALFAARGYDAAPPHTLFGEPEQVAPPSPVTGASVAFDPSSDRALAVWQGEAGAVEYSVRDGATQR
jgi:hypothetical protein